MRCPMLVGRDLELGIVHRAVEAAQHGSGGTVLLLGEAGVGKSRLVAQVCGFARETGLTVACGRAVQAERPAALRPLAEAVLAGMRAEGLPEHPGLDPFRATLGRLVPQWGAGNSAGDPSLVLLGEAVLRLARVLGRHRGFLLVLEDLHWADPETLAVLEYLADNLREEPTLLLATLRPTTTSGCAPHSPKRSTAMSAIPELAATHHAAITVTDLDASIAWYEQVFGFTKFMEGPHPGGYAVLLIEPRSQVILAVHRHDANSGERFSETRTGLDHIGWSVPRREDLDAWQARLESLGVTFTPVVDVEEQGMTFSVIVLRDPDNIQLELCWAPAR